MNLQGSVQNIYKNPATLDDDLNLSGLNKSLHGYKLSNQTPQLFDYLKQSWRSENNLHRKLFTHTKINSCICRNPCNDIIGFFTKDIRTYKASFNAHNIRIPSTLEDGLHNGVKPSTSQGFNSYPITEQPFHEYPMPKIAHAFASNKLRMQENLIKYINHSDTVQKQSYMQRQHYMSGYEPLRWQGTGHDTMVPSVMTHI